MTVRRMTMGEMMVWATAWTNAERANNPSLMPPCELAAVAVCRLRGEEHTAVHTEAFRAQMVER